ncbi:aldo/keto reductase [Acidipila rosea]|uniref:Aryl-alcohol dehydrogenase-like predicted oxidoreductase n=1 Tax=Acidipila rosea TaxID=768535 RepID=A0A4V2PVT7_9BACT|nr:aldo/keto reductase [Acidipila rosea]TCK75161.1 aryl-alcohol dehydrogenase-like predicted oxidoreductase [Acidipila rosea]
MEYFNLNNARVSRIGLGTWAIGGGEWGHVSDADAIATCRAALDRGINLIDTAPIYGHGRSEELIGMAMRDHGRREDFYIATKCGLEWNSRGVFANSDPTRLRREIEDSLRRLATDYIDLYQVHWPDTTVAIEETAALMLGFQQQGKICSIGVSNFSVAQMEAFGSVAPLHFNQPPYNLFERAADESVLPYCHRQGITVLTYSSLCRSLLCGRLTLEEVFSSKDIRSVDPKFQPPRYAQYFAAVTKLDELAQERYGRRVLHLAVRWVLDQRGVSAALWGAKRPAQLDAVEEIMGWTIDENTMREMDAIVRGAVTDPVGPEYLTPAVR